jgi:putative acetyltransferase
MITANTKQSLEAEADYLARIITDNIKGNSIHIVAEADGHVVGNAEISRGKGQSAHTCILGIGLARNYRSIGIGSALIKELFKHAKKLGLRIVYLEVFASNTHAQNLYKKMGFKMTGSFPKKIHYGSKHVDSIIMTKEL